jgi:hypothetical protein
MQVLAFDELTIPDRFRALVEWDQDAQSILTANPAGAGQTACFDDIASVAPSRLLAAAGLKRAKRSSSLASHHSRGRCSSAAPLAG